MYQKYYITFVFLLGYPINKKSSVLPKRVCSKCYDPVWARVHYRISPPRLLAECRNWRLKQGSFVLLYFVLFALLSCIQFVYIPVLFCLSSDWLRKPPPKYVWVGWGVKFYSSYSQLLIPADCLQPSRVKPYYNMCISHPFSFHSLYLRTSSDTYTGWPKKVSHKVLSIFLSNIDRLSKMFTGAFCGKFVINL